MNWKIQHPDRFDRYIRGELPEAERAAFEDKLRADPIANDDFEDQSELIDGIRSFERERMQEWLKQELRKEKSKKGRLLSISRRSMMMAAAILLLIVALVPIYSSLTYWGKMEQRYALSQGTDNLMGVQNRESETLALDAVQTGLLLREQGDLTGAITAFKKVDTPTEKEYDAYFQAQYEMAVTYIMMKDKDQALTIAADLLERPEKHYLKDKAKAMISDLKKPGFWFFGSK